MGTELLRPQDCLAERFRVSPAAFHRRKAGYGNGNWVVGNTKHAGVVNRKPVSRSEKSDQKKRFNNQLENSKKSSSADESKSRLVMGQVTILRRGESLDSLNSKMKINNSKSKSSLQIVSDDFMVSGIGRLGPDVPELAVPKQILVVAPETRTGGGDMYAGSAFSMSPSPRSLPVPSFFNKKLNDAHKVVDDSATRDLRRLLRLE